jgi:hypothetical protein
VEQLAEGGCESMSFEDLEPAHPDGEGATPRGRDVALEVGPSVPGSLVAESAVELDVGGELDVRHVGVVDPSPSTDSPLTMARRQAVGAFDLGQEPSFQCRVGTRRDVDEDRLEQVATPDTGDGAQARIEPRGAGPTRLADVGKDGYGCVLGRSLRRDLKRGRFDA